LARYGGEEYLEKVPKELLQGQTEQYVEYSRTGQVVKGMEAAKAKSKYEEDVYPGNHTSVWGSWYSKSTGQWGYACCHSSTSNSYCTGSAGIEAAAASSTANLLKASSSRSSPPPPSREESKSLADQHAERLARDGGDDDVDRVDQSAAFGKKRLGEEGMKLDKEKLEKALKEERKRKSGRKEEWEDDVSDRKRRKHGGGGMGDGGYEVTEEEMEAYRLNKVTSEDPMANYIDDDDR